MDRLGLRQTQLGPARGQGEFTYVALYDLQGSVDGFEIHDYPRQREPLFSDPVGFFKTKKP